MRKQAPDHTDPKALAGLRRRLALRTQRAIDTARAEGRYQDAERLAADYLRRRQASYLEETRTRIGLARDGAAAVAATPLDQRARFDAVGTHAGTRAHGGFDLA